MVVKLPCENDTDPPALGRSGARLLWHVISQVPCLPMLFFSIVCLTGARSGFPGDQLFWRAARTALSCSCARQLQQTTPTGAHQSPVLGCASALTSWRFKLSSARTLCFLPCCLGLAFSLTCAFARSCRFSQLFGPLSFPCKRTLNPRPHLSPALDTSV